MIKNTSQIENYGETTHDSIIYTALTSFQEALSYHHTGINKKQGMAEATSSIFQPRMKYAKKGNRA